MLCYSILFYSILSQVKFAADSQGIVTQCIQWKNVDRTPNGYFGNLALKINTKLGMCVFDYIHIKLGRSVFVQMNIKLGRSVFVQMSMKLGRSVFVQMGIKRSRSVCDEEHRP